MRRIVGIMLCLMIAVTLGGCGSARTDPSFDQDTSGTDNTADQNQEEGNEEEIAMKLFVNGKEIPVTWEENASVRELLKEAEKNEIVVEMAMYSNNEQVGPLGRRYTSEDRQTTTHNGDIVLYNSSQLVVFYASNSWAYTRLGKMDLTESEVTDLLSNGDVTISIKKS